MTAEQELEQQAREFARLEIGEKENPQRVFHVVAGAMHTLCAAILRAEERRVPPARIYELVAPARETHSGSPLFHRFQTWPRGYPGDFETIEYLFNGVNHAQPCTVPWFIEHYALHSTCTQQHRNKMAWQAGKVLQTCLRRHEPRILSVACSTSRDLRSVQRLLSGAAPRIWLNDADPEALSCSRTHLEGAGCQLEAIPGNAFRSVRKFEEGAPYDLILAGGLFDYLSERQIVWLLQRLFPLLALRGELCFTNVAGPSPHRVWLQHMANWSLIERNEPDLEKMIEESSPSSPKRVTIERDNTGLTCLAQVSLAE